MASYHLTDDAAENAMDYLAARRPLRILIVDDDPLVARIVQAIKTLPPFELICCRTLADAREQSLARLDTVLLDQGLPDGEGLSLLDEIRACDPHLPVLFITAQIGSRTAIEAMKRGAFDYLTKPLDLTSLTRQLQLTLESRRLTRTPVVIARSGETPDDVSDVLVGNSSAMSAVYKAIGRAASSDAPILLIGEMGVGKLLAARAIRQHSARASESFRVVTCNGVSPEQLEHHLFGDEHTSGTLEQCSQGIVVIEDIDLAPFSIQSRLLQYLLPGSFPSQSERPSAASDASFSASLTRPRIIATTAQDLEALVGRSQFRSELYYLLRTITITLPPLRERREDIPLLVDHFISRMAHLSPQYNVSNVRVSPPALAMLVGHTWPGNLDELQSVIRNALMESTGAVLATETLQLLLRTNSPATGALAIAADDHASTHWRKFVAQRVSQDNHDLYAEAVAEMERHVIGLALEETKGNIAHAARLLGITRGSLRKKARAYDLLTRGTVDSVEDHDETAVDLSPTTAPSNDAP